MQVFRIVLFYQVQKCAGNGVKKVNKIIKKILAGVLSAAMIMAFSVPAMADNATPQVYVNFICDGVTSGKYVPSGSNVTAPSVPLHAGFTFCGFDKSLYNVTTNTTYVAVYVNNSLGEEAIRAKKASLPTPAISATTVADPNAAPQIPALTGAAPSALLNLLQAQKAVNTASANVAAVAPAATQAAANAASALQAAAQAAAQNPAVQNAAAQAAATAQNVAQNPAVQNAAAQATAAAQAAAQTPAAQTAAQVVTAAANGLPSWAVSLHGVDAAGVAEVYKYWKTVKNVDDATIQANWDALLNHYAGHGTQGW